MYPDSKTIKENRKFFIPQTSKARSEAVYQTIIDDIKYQLGCKMIDRKIYSLGYTHDKKEYEAVVGELEQVGNRYKILAIFEPHLYIVFAKSLISPEVLTILVNKDEVHTIEDFAE